MVKKNGFPEDFPEAPIFGGKNHDFRLRFSRENQSNDGGMMALMMSWMSKNVELWRNCY